jgi:prokaryotic ubiquitin-like protein Pup
MSQQFITPSSRGGDDENPFEETATAAGQTQAQSTSADSILDDIDQVLEQNADAFVRSFVQKGGE